MKYIFRMLLAALALTQSLGAFAGAGAHGGGGYICDNPIDNEILDLWEGRVQHGFTYTKNYQPVFAQIVRAIDRLKDADELIWKIAKNRLALYYSESGPNENLVKRLPNEATIPFPDDAKNIVDKKGCKPVGVGKYLATTKELPLTQDILLTDFTVLERFNNTDVSAYFFHEIAYSLTRGSDDALDSRTARYLTALLYADNFSVDKLKIFLKDRLLNNPSFIAWRQHLKILPSSSGGKATLVITTDDPAAIVQVGQIAVTKAALYPKDKDFLPLKKSQTTGQTVSIDFSLFDIPNLYDHKIYIHGLELKKVKRSGHIYVSLVFGDHNTVFPLHTFEYEWHKILRGTEYKNREVYIREGAGFTRVEGADYYDTVALSMMFR